MKDPKEPQENIYNQYKETKYCINLKFAEHRENDYAYRIERLYIKSLEQEEVRFSLFKFMQNKDGTETCKLIPRPLDVTEEELIILLRSAISQDVFSKSFLKNLRILMQETLPARSNNPSSTKTEVKINESSEL